MEKLLQTISFPIVLLFESLFAVILPSLVYSATPHQVSIDGINDFVADETIVGSGSGVAWMFTWNESSFYVGMDGTSISGGLSNEYALLYLDATPQASPLSGPGTNVGLTYNTQQPTLPFYADYLISYKMDDTSITTYQWDGSSWSGTTGIVTNSFTSASFLEFEIPFSGIGNPNDIYLLGAFVSISGGSEFTYGMVPSSNGPDSYDPDFAHWLHYNLQTQDADFPNSILHVDSTVVPIPPAVWLFVSGLIGLAGVSRKKK